MAFATENLQRFLLAENDSEPDALLRQLPPILMRQHEVVRPLLSRERLRRVVGLCRLMSELAYRFDPYKAHELSTALRSIMFQCHPSWVGGEGFLQASALGTFYAASTHAALQCGAFADVAGLLEEARTVSHTVPWPDVNGGAIPGQCGGVKAGHVAEWRDTGKGPIGPFPVSLGCFADQGLAISPVSGSTV